MAPALLLIAAIQTSGPPARVVLEPANTTVEAGSSTQLTVTAFDSLSNQVATDSVFWISADDAIATVDGRGVVRGVSPGTVQITVLVRSRPGFATVTVPPLPPAEITLTFPVATLAVGTSAPIAVRANSRLGDRIADPVVQFTSSDPGVARVDDLGRVYAIAQGSAQIRAAAGSVSRAITVRVGPATTTAYRIDPEIATARTGDVIRFRVETSATADEGGAPVYPAWSIDRPGAHIETEDDVGVFVAEQPGRYRVTATIGETITRSTIVSVAQRHHVARLTMVGRGPAAGHHSGDTWVFEGIDGRDYAYIGTFFYDWMKVWDVTDPSNPMLTDSVQLDARRINDVKIHPNNRLGIVTREGASDRRNGIVLLDLTTPAHPTILSEYTATVTGGVHNVWINGLTDIVYAAHNGTSEIHIIDIADPRAPREVGRWGLDKEDKGLHDVIVQDGYAYLSYWDDGVVMLDVGAGSHGGTPTNPVFVSQFKYPIGNTHVAWRAGRYLFVGDELFPPGWNADFPIEARGYIHVIDYDDPENPVEVARYEVPEAGAHNVWVEGDRLYVGYYQGGLRVLDISGELRGDLYRQGREIAVLKTSDAQTTTPNWPMTWGAQIFKGLIYTSDLNSGLWIARLDEEIIIP